MQHTVPGRGRPGSGDQGKLQKQQMNQIYEWLAVPFGWVLHLFYEWTNNYWIALILLVLIVRLVLLAPAIKQQKSTAKQLRLQPKVNRIRAKYSNGGQMTREQQMAVQNETQELYRREGFNPMNAGCLPLLIQFPVMIGLYGCIYTPLTKVLAIASDLVTKAATDLGVAAAAGASANEAARAARSVEISLLTKFTESNIPSYLSAYSSQILHLKSQFTIAGADLTQTPSIKEPGVLWLIPILSFVTAMLSSVIMYVRQRKTNPEVASNPSMGCMTFMSPVMSLVFTFMFPAGVGVYWILSSLFTFIQTIALNKLYSPAKVIAVDMVDDTVQRRAREAHVKKLMEYSGDQK